MKIRAYPCVHQDENGLMIEAAGRTRGFIWVAYNEVMEFAFIDDSSFRVIRKLVPDGYVVERILGADAETDGVTFAFLDHAIFSLMYPRDSILDYMCSEDELDLVVYDKKRPVVI